MYRTFNRNHCLSCLERKPNGHELHISLHCQQICLKTPTHLLSNSPLIHKLLAIGNNDLATFECLIGKISNNATIISKTLFQAAQYGNLEMVQFLVENASLADINVLNEIGETPLFGATYEGHLKIVNYLLDKVI